MPTVAIVDGVKILFYSDEHPPPHFHAKIAEFTAQITIDPLEIIKGSLPPNKVKSIMQWAAGRQAELMTAWIEMEAGRKPGKIS